MPVWRLVNWTGPTQPSSPENEKYSLPGMAAAAAVNNRVGVPRQHIPPESLSRLAKLRLSSTQNRSSASQAETTGRFPASWPRNALCGVPAIPESNKASRIPPEIELHFQDALGHQSLLSGLRQYWAFALSYRLRQILPAREVKACPA